MEREIRGRGLPVEQSSLFGQITHGPVQTSMPSRFPMESPPFPAARNPRPRWNHVVDVLLPLSLILLKQHTVPALRIFEEASYPDWPKLDGETPTPSSRPGPR